MTSPCSDARRQLEKERVEPSVRLGAGCVVTLVDRLVHRAEVVEIEAESYRLKEARERNAARLA